MNLIEKQMSYINDLISEKESDNLPLTKPKKNKKFKVFEQPPIEPITESIDEIKNKYETKTFKRNEQNKIAS